MKTQTISILGLQRTGMSVAMALKAGEQPFTIVGYDSDRDRRYAALKTHEAVDEETRSVAKAASLGDIVVIALPASELETTLDVIGSELREHTLVIDMSPLKSQGAAWAKRYFRQGHYVGARPVFSATTFADATRDAQTARPDLFEESVLCITASAEVEPKAIETTVKFGMLLGAQPYFLDAGEYDNLVQGVDGLPGVAAAALFKALHGATGWRDMLRFADLPFYLSTMPLAEHDDLALSLLNDRDATLRWMDALSAEIATMRRWVAEGDAEALNALLSSLNGDRERWLAERRKNDWLNSKDDIGMESFSLSQMMLGGLARRGKSDKD